VYVDLVEVEPPLEHVGGQPSAPAASCAPSEATTVASASDATRFAWKS
jgi:hypothetical protein